jgi:hypothetical protein
MSTQTAQFPTSITTQLYRAVPRLSTTLTADIDASTETVPVASVTNLPATGFVVIDNETIYYASISSLNLICTGGRGYDGTAASHTSGTAVKYAIVGAIINRIEVEIEAIQNKMGISGATYTTTVDYKLNNLPAQASTAQVTNLNAQYLGARTSGQFVWGTTGQFLLVGSTAADSSKLTNINGATIAENDIEFTADAFNLNNNNPATQVEITGTSVASRILKVEFGNTDAADLPVFKMPRTYNGGTVTLSLLYCSSTASSVFDIGIQTAQAGADAAYNPSYGTAVYFGNITCSATTGNLGFTTKDIVGASLGYTHSKLNYTRLVAGTTCTVQILNAGLRFSKG